MQRNKFLCDEGWEKNSAKRKKEQVKSFPYFSNFLVCFTMLTISLKNMCLRISFMWIVRELWHNTWLLMQKIGIRRFLFNLEL